MRLPAVVSIRQGADDGAVGGAFRAGDLAADRRRIRCGELAGDELAGEVGSPPDLPGPRISPNRKWHPPNVGKKRNDAIGSLDDSNREQMSVVRVNCTKRGN